MPCGGVAWCSRAWHLEYSTSIGTIGPLGRRPPVALNKMATICTRRPCCCPCRPVPGSDLQGRAGLGAQADLELPFGGVLTDEQLVADLAVLRKWHGVLRTKAEQPTPIL